MALNPLTEDETSYLDEVFMNYGSDESILSASELDGFLTAVAMSPEIIPPSSWIPALWGDAELQPTWKSQQEAEKFMKLATQMMNYNIFLLSEHPDEYSGLYLVGEDDKGEEVIQVEEWCDGFLRGLSLWMDDVSKYPKEVQTNLSLLMVLGSPLEDEEDPLADMDTEDQQKLVQGLDPAICELYNYFANIRKAAVTTLVRDSPKIGRNDPCPCGSGKKFKHCCLH